MPIPDYYGTELPPPPQRLSLSQDQANTMAGVPQRLDLSGTQVGAPPDLSMALPSASPATLERFANRPAPVPAAAAPVPQAAPAQAPASDGSAIPPELDAFTAPQIDRLNKALAGEDPEISPAKARDLIMRSRGTAGTAGRRVDAQWVPTSTTTRTPGAIDEGLTFDREFAAQQVAEKQMALAESETRLERAQAAAEEQQAVQAEQAAAQDRQRLEQQAAEVRRRIAEQDDAISKMETREIDPDRFWKNKSEGAKIMAFIGMALGGQDAVENIRNAVDRDIAAQKESMGLAVTGISARRTALQDLTEQYGNQNAAEAALRERQFAAAKQRVAAAQQRVFGSSKEKLEALRAQLEMDQAAAREKFAIEMAGDVASQTAYVPEHYEGGTAGRKADLDVGQELGSDSAAGSVEDQKAAAAETRELERAVRDFRSVRDDYVRWLRTPPENAEERALAKDATARYKSAYWGNVLGRKDAPTADEIKALPIVDASAPVGNAMARLGLGGQAGAREGAAKAAEDIGAEKVRAATQARMRSESLRGLEPPVKEK